MKWLLSLILSITAAAQTVPDSVLLEKDIVYNPAGRLMMDLARPKAAGPHPAVVAIHGGGFRGGSRAGYGDLILKLAQRGYAAATVSYRLAPRNQFPAAVQDVKAAVRFLRANAQRYGIDAERICAVGGSAGGHLALFLGLTPGVADFEIGGGNQDQSSRVSCVVSYFPPTEMAKLYAKSSAAAEVLPPFLGGTPENTRGAYVEASPLHWVTPRAAAILTIHGTNDRTVPYEQSQFLVERLKAIGATAELETIEGGEHGFRGEQAVRAEQRMFEFLDRHLGMQAPQRVLLVSDHGVRGQVVAMEWPSGRELWTVPNRRGHDVQPLPGGHVLYTIGEANQVVEMDASRQPVWTYGPEEGFVHPISAERLANGNTLIGYARSGQVIEVTRDRKIVWKYESADLANMRMRNSRRTAAGTTLIAVEAAGKIIEVNAAGEIIWTFTAAEGAKRRPYKAHRLANGNTILSMTDPGEVVEVDRGGTVVRSIGGEKPDIRLLWVSGFDALASGNLLISDYLGRRILEVDLQGKVVHEVRMPTRTTASIALVP